jgi:hypothetical protein
MDADFSHRHFYNAVVDYFEVAPGPIAQKHIAELLQWWNRCVVTHFSSSSLLMYRPDKSSAPSDQRRCLKLLQTLQCPNWLHNVLRRSKMCPR